MADGEATKALKRTTGQKFHVSRQKRDEYNDSNRITMTRKQRQQYIKKQQQKKKQQGKYPWQRVDYNIEEEDEFMEMVKGYKPNIRSSIIKGKTDTQSRSEKIETTQGVRRRSSVNVGNSNYKRAIKREQEQNINKITRGAAKILAGQNDKSLYGKIKDKTRRIKYNRRLKKAQQSGRLKSRQKMYKLKF